ncbi:MAG: hypothetical protein Q8O83_02530 [bacterium]|nr:hypothetical protein [bacterium]
MEKPSSQEQPQEQELPYEENDESFVKHFRIEAKEKWGNYLNGNEKNITLEERDLMRGFLVEHGTREEIKTKLHSFQRNPLSYEALRKEIKEKRPDIKNLREHWLS